uniref:Uncharacterized protein n=1 Tax=Oryza rufipogon TaxID=4529 RepID=A0A0E0QG93_ORYRU
MSGRASSASCAPNPLSCPPHIQLSFKLRGDETRRKEENPHGTGSEMKQAQLHRCNTPVQGCYSHPMPINVIRYLKTKSNIRQQAIKSETIEGAAAGTHREEAKRKGNTDFVMDDDGCGLPLWPWWRCKDGGGNRNNATVLAWE